MTLQEAHSMLTDQGFRVGQPSTVIAVKDAAICAAAHCGHCGHQGLTYHSYIHPGRWPQGSYRALASCPACGEAEEF